MLQLAGPQCRDANSLICSVKISCCQHSATCVVLKAAEAQAEMPIPVTHTSDQTQSMDSPRQASNVAHLHRRHLLPTTMMVLGPFL